MLNQFRRRVIASQASCHPFKENNVLPNSFNGSIIVLYN